MLVKLIMSSLALLMVFSNEIATASAPVPIAKNENAVTSNIIKCPTIEFCINIYSQKYNIDKVLFYYIVKNESGFNANAVGDMNILCERTGLPVRARGVLQITECWYPDIPDSCAFNVECAFSKMSPIIADINTCVSQYSTCKKYMLLM